MGLIRHVPLMVLLSLTLTVDKFVFLHQNTSIAGKDKPLSASNHLALKTKRIIQTESGDPSGIIF